MESDITAPLGIFDSGIGGLTVLREIRKKLPAEDVIYLGDTARVPYGTRSEQTIIKYSRTNTDFLVRQQIKLLVIACNTASAVATEILRTSYAMPVIDVVGPGARGAIAATRSGRVGIIGTQGTINSRAYERAIQALEPAIETCSCSCPLFVPLAEEGWCDPDDPIVTAVAERYLAPLGHQGIDTLVLGGTHYPLLKQAIGRVMGPEIRLIDSAEETACEVSRQLRQRSLAGPATTAGRCTFYLTDMPRRFIDTGRRFLGDDMQNVTLVDI